VVFEKISRKASTDVLGRLVCDLLGGLWIKEGELRIGSENEVIREWPKESKSRFQQELGACRIILESGWIYSILTWKPEPKENFFIDLIPYRISDDDLDRIILVFRTREEVIRVLYGDLDPRILDYLRFWTECDIPKTIPSVFEELAPCF